MDQCQGRWVRGIMELSVLSIYGAAYVKTALYRVHGCVSTADYISGNYKKPGHRTQYAV
jgi:hypothetical protein